MSEIKSIETQYKGYRFRSRLEARWAVFFDSLRTPFEYEKEGFHLPSGRYLPDFWLPHLGMWLEVKGETPSADEEKKCWELAESTGRAVLMVQGVPGEDKRKIWCWVVADAGGGLSDVEFGWAAGFNKDGPILFPEVSCGPRRVCYADQGFSAPIPDMLHVEECFGLKLPYSLEIDGEKLVAAAAAARSARFEFGETPKG